MLKICTAALATICTLILTAQDNSSTIFINSLTKANAYDDALLNKPSFTRLTISSSLQAKTDKPMEWFMASSGRWAFMNENQKIEMGGDGNQSINIQKKESLSTEYPKELSMLLAFMPQYIIHLPTLGFEPYDGGSRVIDGNKCNSISFGPKSKPLITYYFIPNNPKVYAASYPSPIMENEIALVQYGPYIKSSLVPDTYTISMGEKPKEVLTVIGLMGGIGNPSKKTIVPEEAITSEPPSND